LICNSVSIIEPKHKKIAVARLNCESSMAVAEGWEDKGVARWEGREDAFTAKFGTATLVIARV
jgi:hypothetical protein